MADERSNINSAGSQRLSSQMTGAQEEQERIALFASYVLKPEQVEAVWEAVDPNAEAQRLVLAHIDDISEQCGQDWRNWDENENRFEAGELKWIADYVVASLVFAKSDLQIENFDAICHVVQVLWKTLDLLNMDAPMDLREATQLRNSIL